MVKYRDLLVVKHGLEEAGRTMARTVSQERGAGVQAELAGNSSGHEGPCGVNVSAAVKMWTECGQPATNRLRIQQILSGQLSAILLRCIHWVVTGHDQPADSRARTA
jgi:hypothetical protein